MSTTFRTPSKSRLHALGGTIIAALLLTACGLGEEDTANTEGSDEMHDVNIGSFPHSSHGQTTTVFSYQKTRILKI